MKPLGGPKPECVLVSKCLLGYRCAYDGTAAARQLDPAIAERMGLRVVAVCPEELAGLPTPRPRMELVGGDGRDVIAGRARVITRDGTDQTNQLIAGANAVVRLAKEQGATRIIAQGRSPSCAVRQVPDGSFGGRLVNGMGVTVAALDAELHLPAIELEELVADLLRQVIHEILLVYRSRRGWGEKLETAKSAVKERIPISEPQLWETTIRQTFHAVIPKLHRTGTAENCIAQRDSDTVRFFQQVFREQLGIELLDQARRCRICTYPEGFLDVDISVDGVCSACSAYQRHRATFQDTDALRRCLADRIAEIRGRFRYDGIAACSGGKDSTYMMLRLREEFGLKLLSVMDDLNQQNDMALKNAEMAAQQLTAEFRVLAPPALERNIRRNFLLSGNSFCRLCLRSHFVRLYEVAIREHIPFVFFGLSPYQCLDCPDAIQWSLDAINDVRTPFARQNPQDVLRRYQHRAFQGGFELGFAKAEERAMLEQWKRVFAAPQQPFAPLIVPFFIFDGYPAEDEIMSTISRRLGWSQPEVLLNRTNCRFLRPAGVFHRAVGRFHLNYKERATALRFIGKLLSEAEVTSLGASLERAEVREAMTSVEVADFLRVEFGLSTADLPEFVQARLREILGECP